MNFRSSGVFVLAVAFGIIPACAGADGAAESGDDYPPSSRELPIVASFGGVFDGESFVIDEVIDEPIEAPRGGAAGVAVEPLITVDAGAFGSGVSAGGTGYVALEQLAGSRATITNGVASGAAWNTARCGPVPTTGTCTIIRMRNLFPQHELARAHVVLTTLVPTGSTTAVTVRPYTTLGVETAAADATLFPGGLPVASGLWRYGSVERASPAGGGDPGRPEIAWAFTGSTPVGASFQYRFWLEVRAEIVDPIQRVDLVAPSIDTLPYGSGVAGDGAVDDRVAMSAGGRYVFFSSSATNLLAGATSAVSRVYRKDMQTGAVVLVSTSPQLAMPQTCHSHSVDATSAGTIAVFQTDCALDPADTAGAGDFDIYVRDLVAGTTTLVSRAGATGAIGNGPSTDPAISSDGRHVAFVSTASNLVAGRPSGRTHADVYRVAMVDRRIHLASRTTASGARMWPNASSGNPVLRSVNDTQAWLYYESTASDIVAGDTNRVQDIFGIELDAAGAALAVGRMSVSQAGAQLEGPSRDPFVAGAHFVYASLAARVSYRPPTAPGDTWQIYYRPSTLGQSGKTRLISYRDRTIGNGDSAGPTISPDGRWLAFHSTAPSLTDRGFGGRQAFVVDRLAVGPLVVRPFGSSADSTLTLGSGSVADAPVRISDDGAFVAFSSAQALVAGSGVHAYRSPVRDVLFQ
jgi:hypothetical protein